MKKHHNKCYGYKVCYKEENATSYVRHFLTYTYKQAKQALCDYVRYPPTAREDNHKLVNPKWKIIPVNNNDMKQGIWRELPF